MGLSALRFREHRFGSYAGDGVGQRGCGFDNARANVGRGVSGSCRPRAEKGRILTVRVAGGQAALGWGAGKDSMNRELERRDCTGVL